MRAFAVCLFAALAAACFAQSPATFPTEIKLTNGATLRNTRAEKWASDSVVIKHAGGVDRIQFRHIAAASRAAVLAARPGTTPPAAQTPPAVPSLAITGQIYSKGLDQPYLFAGTPVKLFRAAELRPRLESNVAIEWPQPVAETTTDAKGQFALTAPAGEYVIYAADRRYYKNRQWCDYLWIVDAPTQNAEVLLTDANATLTPSVTAPGLILR